MVNEFRCVCFSNLMMLILLIDVEFDVADSRIRRHSLQSVIVTVQRDPVFGRPSPANGALVRFLGVTLIAGMGVFSNYRAE